MAIELIERPDSRSETLDPPTYTTRWKVTGEVDDLIAGAHADSQIPFFIVRTTGTLYRNNLDIEPDGWSQFKITAAYKKKDQDNLPQGEVSFSFDTSGATINIKAAKEHLATYEAAGVVTGNFHKGAINVKGDGDVEGADIIVPALKMSWSIKQPEGIVNTNFAKTMARNTGKVNVFGWLGFAAGELLFVGASGSDGTDADAQVTYSFVASPNETDFTIGDIAGITKKGHDLAWVEFKDEVEDGAASAAPKRVHIERVYNQVSFSNQFGFG